MKAMLALAAALSLLPAAAHATPPIPCTASTKQPDWWDGILIEGCVTSTTTTDTSP